MTSAGTRMTFGYARVSTLDQNEALQLDALQAVGCDDIFTDHSSGKLASRPALDDLLSRVRPGDTVVVWKLDRLGRSLKHLLEVVALLPAANLGGVAEALVGLQVLRQMTQAEVETVGGPMDVGLITPSSGFTWIKRQGSMS